MKLIFKSLLLLFFILPITSKAQDVDARIKRIENSLTPRFQIKGYPVPKFNIEERLKELGIPGISIAFVANGKVEWARAYGMADVAEGQKMTPETLLLAGSISKPVAALRAHQLVENGTFDLDGNVNQYLKSWQVPDNEFTAEEKVTLRRILNHTAGLTVWGFPGYDKGDKVPSVVEVLDGKGNTDAVRVYKKPGESWQYSGGGYTIMQLMITDTEDQSFPEIMQQNVLNPLGMEKSTFANPLPEKYHDLAATGYRANGNEVEGKWPIYPEMAAAGLWTTPTQLIQYAIEIQKIYTSKKDGILKSSTVDEMLTPGFNGHGLGPTVSDFSFGHGGADEGFRANLTAWKDEPYALVMMVNSDNSSIMEEVTMAIVNEYKLSGIEPLIREPIVIPEEELKKFVGTYKIADLGDVEIKLVDGKITAAAPFINPTLTYLPSSKRVFFDTRNGSTMAFRIKRGEVIGFNAQGFYAEKLKD